ncbi:protein kinase GIN4 [Saccharomyces eubayanus]|uniref:protein kinase GIN4 n=1 Tax=Saccharomyces eubayanus TaxID=1080349 RepID=UPI0006C26D4A|nr:GIN4-like protein [Saccharomyces eubayanus]KOH01310.1 GIN4-like protein [Saccharomyces eubayanus]
MAVNGNSIQAIKDNTIGPWKLGETLGLGSTGKVQLARNKSTGQEAAVKVISKAVFNSGNVSGTSIVGSTTPDALPYGIEREIIIMKLLNHPNVLRLYDVWETNTDLYLVLEYAEKGELFNLLVERGPLPENEAIRFFRQIIIGVSYCHALGIVHRDLKPENLLLDHKYNIKIADFGMAALETEGKLLETSCGSPHYAAPEIVSGIPYQGFASDVWSCGVILFALLTGRLPFDEEDGNIRALLLKVQKGEFELPSDDEISREAQDLISKILTVNPERRIKARDILKHPLLQKYPSIRDSKSIRDLPREDTYLTPLSESNSSIDSSILQNLVILWHGRDPDGIRAKLQEPGANAEKTLYALLYRFKCDTQKELIKQQQIKKRQSISSVSISPPKRTSTTPQRRRNRESIISVSSSRKKPISFNKFTASSASSSNLTTPGSSKRLSKNFSSKKKLSTIVNQSSPTPSSRNKRASIANVDKNQKRASIFSTTKKNKRASKSTRRMSLIPSMKRESVTTKLMSTYAKLAEDDDWEYIEKETKRTSSNFATLIDEIFEYEKYDQIRKEKEELERKVKEAKAREELERRKRKQEEKERSRKMLEKEELKRKQEELKKQIEIDISDLEHELINHKEEKFEGNIRSISAPMENEENNINHLEADIDNILRRRNFSLQTRPVSRLDPGIIFSSPIEPEDPVEPKKAENERLTTEKKILETIRRSKFLGSSFNIDKELKLSQMEYPNTAASQRLSEERIVSDPDGKYEPLVLPKDAKGVAHLKDNTAPTTAELLSNGELRKISDIRVPQFTRKSRHFSESNKRLSVLSMYSTKESFTNLVDILKNGNLDVNPQQNQRVPTPRSADDSEFLFETVNEEAECTGNSSNDERLYDMGDSCVKDKNTLKLNFADRFNGSNNEKENNNLHLPTLPPLNGEDGANKQGEEKKEKEELHEQAKVKSMIPESDSSSHAEKEQNEKEDQQRDGKDLEPPLNKTVQKTREKNNGTQAKNQSTDLKPNKNASGSGSFFRKFSKSSTSEKSIELYAKVSAKQLFIGLEKLLRGWNQYGLKNVKSNPNNLTLTGKLSSENMFSLRSTLFEVSIYPKGKVSVVDFKKISGSFKSVKKLVKEVENVLNKEGVLQK